MRISDWSSDVCSSDLNGSAGIPAASTSMTAPLILPKTLVLVGMMGAGKTAIGRRLATRLALPFVDADAEIEQAAGSSIPEIFERHGEAAFREGERRIIARLLRQPVQDRKSTRLNSSH